MSRVAIITGSSSGIGAATALELSKRGWSVVINYSKSEAQAKKVAAQCKDAIAVQADVADAIVWLIEGARRVTGEIVYIDGGMHIASPR